MSGHERGVSGHERRFARRHPQAPIEAALDRRAADDPAATIEARLEAQRVWDVVMELPEERRQAVVLRFVNELSAREIGQIMGEEELIRRPWESVEASAYTWLWQWVL